MILVIMDEGLCMKLQPSFFRFSVAKYYQSFIVNQIWLIAMVRGSSFAGFTEHGHSKLPAHRTGCRAQLIKKKAGIPIAAW
jgi:hypothetical protein